MEQGKDSVDDYVAQFRILAGKAKMTDNAALTEYFMEGINTGILQKIFAQEKLPATITEWYERTLRCDSHLVMGKGWVTLQGSRVRVSRVRVRVEILRPSTNPYPLEGSRVFQYRFLI